MKEQLLQDLSSQHAIARNGSSSCNILEGFQGGMPKWYFNKKEIDDHSPSRKDGVDFKKESELRKLYCSFLQDLGMKLKVPQVTIATAMLLCHRFYLRQSHAKNEWQTIATVCMFLACKVEETPRLLMDAVVVAYEIMYRKNPAAAQRIKQKDVYVKQKELIVTGERVLLATIAFDFNIQLPYKPLVAALKRMEISHISNLAKVAWNFVNDWLQTTLCLQYKPHYIAAGSMYLAAKFQNMKLPSESGKVWWLEFDVVPRQLEEVIQQMLGLLEENRKLEVPSFPDKATLLVKEELSNSTQSRGPSEPITKSNSNDLCMHNSRSLPHKDTFEAKKEVLQSHKSNSGSSRSVVDDGDDRSNGGEVPVESNPIPRIKIVSVSWGLTQIEKDRIREAMKKRKINRVANKKVVVETDKNRDDGSWIERELENGLDLEYSSAEKRQKRL